MAYDFNEVWNYPHCIGALDGKHVQIQRPENTVAEYYNYKGTHSIVLMAIVDAHYKFLYVDVGCQGRISDGGVFKNTTFHKKMLAKGLGLPQDEPLEGRDLPVPYVLLADDAFPLTENIMKPYVTDLNRGSPQRTYNWRHSRGRVVVENAFGVMSSVFRVFRKPIEVKVENTVIDIVLACVYLHNFLRSQPDCSRNYTPPGTFDREDVNTREVIPGTWRRQTSGDTGLTALNRLPRNMAVKAKQVRSEFKEYFLTAIGSISNGKNK